MAFAAGAVVCLGAAWADDGSTDAALLDRIAADGAQIVILGEVHDNPGHHAFQARAVAALHPTAIVFEMLTPDQAAGFDPALLDDPAALGAALDWTRHGWPDFALYHPIFAAAPEAAIYGAGLPREAARAAVADGAATSFGREAVRFGLNQPLLPEEQNAREAEQMEAHCDALPAEMLPAMVEAQRLRDAHLARAALAARAETGGPVAVITGNGHARIDQGVPSLIARAAPELHVFSLGQLEAPATGAPFDAVRITDPAQRDDPCAVFRQG